MLPDDPLRTDRRRRVLVVATLMVVLLGVVALKLTTMQAFQALGDRAWSAGDMEAADRHFAVSGRLNVAERWIGPFNRGVAAYGQREWDDAADWFARSFELAPDEQRCKVALSWAWSHESAGDELEASGHARDAALQWDAAAAVLARVGECDDGATSGGADEPEPQPEEPDDEPAPEPSDAPSEEDQDAASSGGSPQDQREQTQQRIEDKQRGAERTPPPENDDPSADQKTDELSERNDRAARARQSDEDQRQESSDGPRRTW